MGMDAEVANPFSNERNIQIVWNSGFELFKKQLTTLRISCREDFNSQFETCKDKFLIAEQHRTAKEAKAPAKPKPPPNQVDKNKGGGDKSKTKRYGGKCSICDKTGHKAADCFQNPNSKNHRPKHNGQGGGEPSNKKRNFESSFGKNNPKFQKWKEQKQFEAFCQETGEDGFVEE